MSATTESARFIAPYVAQMDASGAAEYNLIQQETVSISGIDYEFDVTLDASGAVQLLNSFTVSGKGTDANFNVTLSNSADFEAVLASVINGAYEAARGGETATTQLESDLHAGLVAAINSDGLLNTVEDVDVTSVDVTIASAAGAADMASNLSDERCRLIYTQIPWGSRFGKYNDVSENQTTSALPLLAGDILTFVFDVNLSDVTPVQSQVDVNQTADPSGVTTDQTAGNYSSGLHYDLASKRIAFNVRMPGTAGDELTGLKA